MKTNTFIFNFINPSRLVCLAKDAPAEKPSDKGSGMAENMSGVDTAITKVAEEKGKTAAEAAKRQIDRDDPWIASNQTKKRKIDIEDPWVPTKEEAGTILKGKAYEVRSLLAEFANNANEKVDYKKWNERILGILGKNNETLENKKNWLKAFQEYAGTKVDYAVGPKTMLALAGKMEMGEYGKKIEGTMIARRSKKTPDTVTSVEGGVIQADVAKLKSEAEREAQYAALGMPNPLGGNKETPVTQVTQAETYMSTPKEDLYPGRVEAGVYGLGESKIEGEVKKEEKIASAGTYYSPDTGEGGTLNDEAEIEEALAKGWKRLKEGEEPPKVATLYEDEEEQAQG